MGIEVYRDTTSRLREYVGVGAGISGLNARNELEAVFQMCWDVLQHRFKGVGEQPCDALGWSIDVRYDGSYFNIRAGFVGLDEMVEPGQIGV